MEKSCDACGATFSCGRSRVAHARRCQDCIAAGKRRCEGCGTVWTDKTAAGRPGRFTCSTCRTGRSRTPTAGYRLLRCRGQVLQFGTRSSREPAFADGCRHEWFGIKSRAERLKSFDASTSTFVCQACHGLQSFVNLADQATRSYGYLKAAKRDGRKPTRVRSLEAARQVMQEWPFHGRATPPLRPSNGSDSRNARSSARKEAHYWRARVAKFGGGKRVVMCAWCNTLVFSASADSQSPYRARPTQPVAVHRQCWNEMRATDEGRRWLRQRRELRAGGMSAPVIDQTAGRYPPMPRRRGPAPDPDLLARDLEWAVKHLWGGQTRDELAARSRCLWPLCREAGPLPDRSPPGPGDGEERSFSQVRRRATRGR